MLLQVAQIVANACDLLTKYPNEPKVRLAALKCIQAVSDLGVGLPIQHVVIISAEAVSEDRSCRLLAQRICRKQKIALVPKRGKRVMEGDSFDPAELDDGIRDDVLNARYTLDFSQAPIPYTLGDLDTYQKLQREYRSDLALFVENKELHDYVDNIMFEQQVQRALGRNFGYSLVKLGLVPENKKETFGNDDMPSPFTVLRSRKPLPLVLQRQGAKRATEGSETAGSPLG